MPKSVGSFLWVLAILGALTACAPVARDAETGSEIDAKSRTIVDRELAEAAVNATKALSTLAAIEAAQSTPIAPAIETDNLPEELTRPTSVDWSGPAEILTGRIAGSIGYQFAVVGKPPPNDVIVQLSLHDVPAAKALESIGLQSAPFVTLIVDPNSRRIEFRYDNTAQRRAS